MKRLTGWILIVVMALSMGGALAESAPAEEAGDFFDHMRTWWQSVTTEAADLSAGLAEYFAEGAEIAKEALAGYIDEAEAWLSKNLPNWTDEVQKAWNTLKEAAVEGTAEARAQAQEAYEVIRAWMLEVGESMGEGVRAVINAMVKAAGVEVPEGTLAGDQDALLK